MLATKGPQMSPLPVFSHEGWQPKVARTYDF